MKRIFGGVGAVCLFLLCSISVVSAKTIEVKGAGVSKTIQCDGNGVQVTGSANKLTLLGECPALEVDGTGNKIEVESVSSIEVEGTGNEIVWGKGIGGIAPKVEEAGVDNEISQGTVEAKGGAETNNVGGTITTTDDPAEDDSAIEIDGKKVKRTIQCDGQNVHVKGTRCSVKLRGVCNTLSVEGNRNKVSVEKVRTITVLGNRNAVSWQSGVDGEKPKVSDQGNRNKVKKK